MKSVGILLQESLSSAGNYLRGCTQRLKNEEPLDYAVSWTVEVVKTTFEILALLALFIFIGERFHSEAALVAAFVMNVVLGIYLGNKLSKLVYALIPRAYLLRYVIQLAVLVVPILWAKQLVSGIVSQLGI